MKATAGGVLAFGAVGQASAQADAIRITTLNAPSQASPGDSITVTGNVRNTGDTEVTVTIEYRIAGRARASQELTLAPGAETEVELSPDLPSDLNSGTYRHGLFVVGTERRRAADITITAPGEPEYRVANFRGPSQANPDQKVTAEAEVRNVGNAEGSTPVQYRIGDQVVATKTVTLASGASRTVTLSGTVPSLSPATYQQGIFVGDTDVGQTGSLVVGARRTQFEVLSLQAPSETRNGDSITATATVRNTGDAGGSVTFQYRIGDRTVASRDLTLASGQRATVEFSGTVPDIAAGTYTQGVFVADTTNGLTSRLTIQSREASFSVTNLSGPSRAEVGDEVSAQATVQNTGNASGTGTFQYRIDGTRIATREVSLDVGASRTVTLTGTVPDRSPGTYNQGVFVGGSNRGLTTSLRIDERPAARFIISGLRAPSTAEVGEEITVRATVTNTGNATGSTRVEYRIDGERIDRQRVELRADRSTTVEFDVTVPDLRRGTYTQGVFVEGTSRGQTTSLQVAERPRFTVGGLQAPPSATVGDSISVRATVRNRGDSRATRTVEYRLGDRIIEETDLRLDAGQSRTVTFEGTVPNLAPGTYRHGVFVEGQSVTAGLTVRARPEPRPNIGVRSFRGPSNVTVGDAISVEATVRNSGDASGSITIEYRIDDRIVTARQVTLDAGAERTVTMDATVPSLAAGTYEHGVFVAGTAQGQVREVTVSAGSPRFTVGDLRGPGRVMAGEEITVRASVTNTGNAAGETSVQYRIDDEVVASQTVDLDAGASTDVAFDVAIPDLTPDTYQHGVFIGETDRGQSSSLVVEPEPTPTPTATPTPTPTPTSNGVLGPGFGVGTGLASLAAAGGVARLYRTYLGSETSDGSDP